MDRLDKRFGNVDAPSIYAAAAWLHPVTAPLFQQPVVSKQREADVARAAMGYLSKLALRVDPGGAGPDVTASSASPAVAIAAEFLGGSSITVTRSAQAHRSFVTQLPLLVAVRDDAVHRGASAQDTYGLREGDRLPMLRWMAAQILRTPPSSAGVERAASDMGDIITIERNRLGNDLAEALMIVNKSLRNEEVEKAAMSSGGERGGRSGGCVGGKRPREEERAAKARPTLSTLLAGVLASHKRCR